MSGMSSVSADSNQIRFAQKVCQEYIQVVNATKRELVVKLSDVSSQWDDSKLQELSNVLNDCINELNKPLGTVEAISVSLGNLLSAISEYEKVYFNGDSAMSSSSCHEKGSALSRNVSHAIRCIMYPTSKEVAGRLNSLGVKNVKLRGIPPSIQNEIASSFEIMAKNFPESVNSITTVTTSMNMSPSSTASVNFGVNNDGILQTTMSINPEWFGNENLEERITENTNRGEWAGRGIPSILNHEIAHAMHLQLDAEELGIHLGDRLTIDDVDTYNELQDRWCMNTTTNQMRNSVLNSMGLSRDDIADAVSLYADTDGSECFAECVADYTTSSNPSQISVNLVQEYRRRLNNIRSGGGF